MGITLGMHALPNGLRWEDELGWSPIGQSAEYSIEGALIIQETAKLAGRPITLRGGRQWAWMQRDDLLDLKAALEDDEVELLLTLHDSRTFTVTSRHSDGQGPIEAYPLPIVRDSGPADPTDDSWYWVEAIRLMTTE